ncbi:MAG TPA: DegT/DnrJ/EryC1/StrS family aminotransferase [bacterium]|nr:DegT/DnrJ/EryC1/StrS family aminotransferase [bacterium]
MRIPFGTITITDTAKKLINDAINNNRISNGKYVREFEEKFAAIIGVKEAVAVSSGTDADILAMAVLYDFGAVRGDEIIVPALSFVATGNAVLHAGFTPVFVDIEKETLNINPQKIEEKITKKTRAIMPVHLMGKPANMDIINAIAKSYNLYVIEDAAEAHGTIYKNKPAGNLADIGAFSLYIAHIITTGEGGIITTNTPEFSEILLSLRSHGRACKCKKCLLNISGGYCNKRFANPDNMDIRFIFERIGFSSKMNELEAAIGLGALENYHQILDKRRKNLYYLIENFKQFQPYLATITKEDYEEIGPHALPIILNDTAKFTRNQLKDYLEKNGIETRSLFLSMPTQCPGFKFLGYKYGEFPNAEYMGHNGLHIGVHQDLSKTECDYVLNIINDFIQKNK